MRSRSRRLGSAAPGGGLLPLLPPALVAVAIVAAGVWFLGRSGGGEGDTSTTHPAQSSSGMPAYITTSSARVQEAYAFAASHGAELAYIPCYCGCGGHSGHRNVRDCFIKSGSADAVTYEEHGSQCDICVSIVLDTKAMLAQGDTLAMVRTAIDRAYVDVGPATDTPLPPGMEE